MKLFIEPLDVMFFRDGKPFVAGQTHLAQSLFPPTSLPFQGAIRSAILAASGVGVDRFQQAQGGAQDAEATLLVEEIGGSTSFGHLRLRGPFVASISDGISVPAVAEERFPCPADVLTHREDEGREPTRLLPVDQPPWMSDLSDTLWPLWGFTSARLEAANGFINGAELARYLAGDAPQVMPITQFVTQEERLGIGLSPGKKVAEEGQLYTREVYRFNATNGRRLGFILDVEGTTRLPPRGMLALGGERRGATYEHIAASQWPEGQRVAQAIDATRYFLLYLATPALFTQDPVWLPDFIDPDSLVGTRNGVTIKVRAVSAGRPVPIGGWDLASNRPRAMHPAIPASSVYWCEVLSGIGQDVMRAFHGQCLSSMFAEIGFRQTFVGRWPHV
jgi:CRISPR-associated protein Cmr3